MKKTTLCYIRNDGAVLMLYRNKKKVDVNGGKWVGVGGKLLPGETPEHCLLREVKEETGLTLTSWHFHGVIGFLSDMWEDEEMYLYSADGFEGEMISCDEGDLSWIAEERVMDLPMWAGDRCFLEPLLAGQEKIELTLRYEGETLVSVEPGYGPNEQGA